VSALPRAWRALYSRCRIAIASEWMFAPRSQMHCQGSPSDWIPRIDLSRCSRCRTQRPKRALRHFVQEILNRPAWGKRLTSIRGSLRLDLARQASA